MAKTKVSKGKGSSGRREEKRKKRFVSGPSSGGAKANVLREKEEGGAAGGAKRKREEGSGAAAPRKTYKQGTFARPVAVRREPPPAAPADPLSKKDLKVLAEARKATKKPNYALVQARGPTSRQPELRKEITVTWEKLRRLSASAEERSKLTTELAAKVQGRAKSLATSHKASRVMQSILKYGTPQQVASLAAELHSELPALAKDPYATHLVRRLIEVAGKAELPALTAAFKGSAVRLARHPFAAPALDALYVRLSAAQRSSLLAEFYGPQVALARNAQRASGLDQADVTLASVLAAAPSTSARQAVLGRLAQALTPILEKGLVSFAYVHRLLAEFLPVCGAAGVADAATSIAGPALLRMIHTPDGARAAAALLAGASARERKGAIKALKGRVVDVAKDPCGHVALLAALECVDDTALLSKSLLNELQPHLAMLARHRSARRLLLNLLHPRCPRYLPPDILAALPVQAAPAPGAAEAAGAPEDGGAASEDDGADNEDGVGEGKPGVLSASKKPAGVRRAQLLAVLAQPLLDACAACAPQLLRHPLGCDVLYECARGGEAQGVALAAGQPAVLALQRAVVAAAAAATQAPDQDVAADDDEEAAATEGGARGWCVAREEWHATRTLRRLVLDSPSFAQLLWAGALKGHAALWAAGHGAKVLAALVACDDAATAKAAAAELAATKGLLAKGQSPAQWAASYMHQDHADAPPPPKPAAVKKSVRK